MFAMVVLEVVLNISRRGCHFFLYFAQHVVKLALSRHKVDTSPQNSNLVENFPVDPDTVRNKFPLDGKATVLAVCPKSTCHMTYAPTFHRGSPVPRYSRTCTRREYKNGPICGTALTRKHESGLFRVPIKRFVSFSFKDYIARLLCSEELERSMDNPAIAFNGEGMYDVFDGEFLRGFKDKDGNLFRSDEAVGRYAFSVGVDFFNPFTNKQAGKKSSVGVITVVCLNLPAAVRYKTENMFLAGVIPGPNEPPLTAINHYLTPLTNEFLELWSPGVSFSQTALYPGGRLVLCALVLLICDLLAARKTAGLASCTHKRFCSVCHCTNSKDERGLQDTNYQSWTYRTNAESRKAAERYQNASTPKARQDEFDATGVRWSELLRLPYFDIVRCVVVDSMHNLFLGLIKEHFEGILGIGLPAYREGAVVMIDLGEIPDSLSENDRKGVKKIKALLEAPISTSFPSRDEGIRKMTVGVNAPALEFVCDQLGCSPPPPPSPRKKATKAQYASHLFDWVCLLSMIIALCADQAR